MSRLLIQSTITHEFLHSSPATGDVCWTPSLHTALVFGLIPDQEMAAQLIEDHCDRGAWVLVDIDNVPEV